MQAKILKTLQSYYEEQKIAAHGFDCPHRDECSTESPGFTEAKASYVGPLYGETAKLPRLLFLSLDSGSADEEPENRTLEGVRKWNVECDVERLPRNRHWYRTHELAQRLFAPFRPGISVADTRLFFAHVNSAKCCQNNPGRAQANPTLFKNCCAFIPEELKILEPEIIVTQGKWAKEAICEGFEIQEHTCKLLDVNGYRNPALYETGEIEIGSETRALWISTYHPAAFGYFNPQRKQCWDCYAAAVKEFWNTGTPAA